MTLENKLLVFVCIFNRERSPIAEYLYRDRLRKKAPEYLDRIHVSSGGFIGREIAEWIRVKEIPLSDPVFGQPPSDRVRLRLRDRGIDISHFRSKQIDRETLMDCTMAIPLLGVLKRDLIAEYPDVAYKTFAAEEIAGADFRFTWEDRSLFPGGSDFVDFVHKNDKFIDDTIDQIEEFLYRGWDEILSRLFPG